MKTAIMQPYLFPYIGYFQLIGAVDQFTFYDDVAYIKNGWINRNRYLWNGQAKYFTLSLDNASSFRPINQTYILNDERHRTKEKVFKILQMAYSRAPLAKTILELIEQIVLNPENNIAVYNENAVRKICAYLNIQTPLYISSETKKNTDLRAQEKVIDLCKNLGTRVYINAVGGKALYDHESFSRNGMELKFLRPNLDRITYKQFDGPFFPGLSIIDVLMFNPPEEIRAFLDAYSLEN